jgi:hypothetical protein
MLAAVGHWLSAAPRLHLRVERATDARPRVDVFVPLPFAPVRWLLYVARVLAPRAAGLEAWEAHLRQVERDIRTGTPVCLALHSGGYRYVVRIGNSDSKE